MKRTNWLIAELACLLMALSACTSTQPTLPQSEVIPPQTQVEAETSPTENPEMEAKTEAIETPTAAMTETNTAPTVEINGEETSAEASAMSESKEDKADIEVALSEQTAMIDAEITESDSAVDITDDSHSEETEMAMEESGPSPEQQALLASLQSRGPAPALTNEVWLNTEPLAWDDLRGKVLIVEFWTYG